MREILRQFYSTANPILLMIALLAAETPVLAQKTTIAVMDFEARGISQLEVAALTDRLRNELFRLEKFQVVERGMMETILIEQDFQLTGCTSDECLVEVGQLLGAEMMVGGSISKVGDMYTASARIVDVETGQVIMVADYDLEGKINDMLTIGMRALAIRLAVTDETQVPETRPPVEAPEQVRGGDIQNAIIEAEAAATRATNTTLWFGAGCFGSVIGLGAAYVYKPNPPAIALLGKSPEYVAVYTDRYKAKAGSIQQKYALYGCGAFCVAYVLSVLIGPIEDEPEPVYY